MNATFEELTSLADVCIYRVPCAFSLNVTANYREILKELMFK